MKESNLFGRLFFQIKDLFKLNNSCLIQTEYL